MKNFYSIIIAFLFFLPTSLFSQEEFICGADPNLDPDPQGAYSYSNEPIDFEVDEPLVLRTFIWQVQDPLGGYNGITFTEDDTLRAVANLNMEYNQFNIFFKYIGWDSFETPGVPKVRYEDPDGNEIFECIDYPGEMDPEGFGAIDYCQRNDLFGYASSYGYRINDALNIYIPYRCDFFGGLAWIPGNRSIVPYYSIDDIALPHEVAHNLGLQHTTYEWTENDPDPNNPDYPCADWDCEHVTRTPSDSNYNATCKADKISDTNAVPNFKREHYQELLELGYTQEEAEAMDVPYNYVENCIYIGSGDDCEDQLYNINPDDVSNLMLPAHPDDCEEFAFTHGQGRYMRESINWYSTLRDLLTDVSSLYEPYTGEYFVAGPIPNDPPLFQPGFDYWFVSCSCEDVDFDCDEPCDFDETSFENNHTIILNIHKEETDYSIITHPNHSSIYIDQLSQLSVRRCYDNWNRGAIGGSVTLFNDGVINTNVTVTSKDSLGINNQNLIIDLPQGLYKIEKNYNDGTTQQAIIQKGNN
jgi:hypothetical protein